ncbi:MAG: phospholipase D-like domain-containing protein [Acidobacteriota bacterium]
MRLDFFLFNRCARIVLFNPYITSALDQTAIHTRSIVPRLSSLRRYSLMTQNQGAILASVLYGSDDGEVSDHLNAIAAKHEQIVFIMSSFDLTFITNESGASLSERFKSLLGPHTRFFDCLVGYFFISGFHKLYPALEQTEKIRILIGLKTDQSTFDFLQEATRQGSLFSSHAEVKENVPEEILQEIDKSEDRSEVEEGVRKFIDWVCSGKLEIKAYPSARIHAKLYIMTFVEGLFDKGRVITGSSNFSQAGLQDNLEFNVELKQRSDYEFARQKFEELWAESVDVSQEYVDTIRNKSPFAEFSPYELYLKFLYEYFKSEVKIPAASGGAFLYII